MLTVRENLIAAKALIDTPEKWGKGDGLDGPDSCHCVETACSAVVDTSEEWESCLDILSQELPEPWTDHYAPHHYNDHPDTTHADIMALFDRAISAAQ